MLQRAVPGAKHVAPGISNFPPRSAKYAGAVAENSCGFRKGPHPADRYSRRTQRSKTRILVVGSTAFSQLIRHLFENQPAFEVVASRGGLKNLGPRIEQLHPTLIVASVRVVGTNIQRAAHEIKRFCPCSKLILIFPYKDLAETARDSEADACLEPEELM